MSQYFVTKFWRQKWLCIMINWITSLAMSSQYIIKWDITTKFLSPKVVILWQNFLVIFNIESIDIYDKIKMCHNILSLNFGAINLVPKVTMYYDKLNCITSNIVTIYYKMRYNNKIFITKSGHIMTKFLQHISFQKHGYLW